MDNNLIPQGTIAVGIDGSPGSDRALTWAVEQAASDQRPLTLVHAVNPMGAVWMDQAGQDTRVGLRAMQTYSEELLASARNRAEHQGPGLVVHELVRVADARTVLLEVARRSAMVVVGSRGRGPVSSLLLGSVGLAVVRHAECPVVVVRPVGHATAGHGVLLGLDGTDHDVPAVEFAFRHASRRHLPLRVLRCVVAGDSDALDGSRALHDLGQRYPQVPVEVAVVRGGTEALVARLAEPVDLVVIGSAGSRSGHGLHHATLPVVVVEHATCPVVVVPGEVRREFGRGGGARHERARS